MNIKLKLIQTALKVAILAANKAEWIKEELYWAEVRNTPVGPNPHPKGTIEWYLWENGNKLAASIRLKKVNSRSPWIGMFRGKLADGASSPEFGYCATFNPNRAETNETDTDT